MLGVIQIMGDKGGLRRCVTHTFLIFEALIKFAFQSKLGLKISDKKREKCHRGGGWKKGQNVLRIS